MFVALDLQACEACRVLGVVDLRREQVRARRDRGLYEDERDQAPDQDRPGCSPPRTPFAMASVYPRRDGRRNRK